MLYIYIFLSVILFFLILLCCPVFLQLSFKESLSLKIKFLFFSVNICPRQNKKKLNKETEKKDNRKNFSLVNSKFLSIIKERGFLGFLKILRYLIDFFMDSAKSLLKKIHITSFNLYLRIADEDAATLAINYGRVCTLVSCAKSVLLKDVNEKKCKIKIIPAFNETRSEIDFFAKLYFFPISVLRLLVISLYKFAKNMYINRNAERV